MMTEEIPLELIPELTQSERQSATKITFNNTNGETDIDFIGLVDGFRSIAPTNAYKFVALEGETYSFLSVSFFPPFLRVYGPDGTALAAKSDEMDEFYRPILHDKIASVPNYEYDYIHEWEAPQTGTFFIKPGWSQGNFNSYFAILIDKDTDTSTSNINDLFDYGEATYPDLFPEHQNSQNYDELGYYARFYSNGFALGEKDGDIYLYDGNDIKLIGSANDLKHLLVEDVSA